MTPSHIIYALLFGATSQLFAAPTLQIAMGESKMPYVSAETHSGVEYEILNQTLIAAGFAVQIEHLPNKRAQLEFEHGKFDAVIDNDGAILSEPYIAYKNMAITLCNRKINISSVNDLAKYQVGAFHNANQFLGADFARIASNTTQYRELSPQQLMNRMLLEQHIDVAISDVNIFKHHQQELDPQAKLQLCPASIFPPTLYRLKFRNTNYRDKFNIALKQLREQGLYEKLAKKYNLPLDQLRPYFKP